MPSRAILRAIALAFAVLLPAESLAADITVYRQAGCNCCGKWAQLLRDAGHVVAVNEVANMSELKTRLGVPDALASCHTAVVDGYVIEGHVPVADVERLIAEKPAAKGLAVPGMPIGSPGMEVEGEPAETYDVTLFGANGERSVFATH